MLDKSHIAIQSAIWLSQFCYFIGFVPQIVLNYRLKSLRGLSDLYLFAFFNGYLADLYYVYCLNLPFPYRVGMPLCTIAMSIVVFQRFYYDDSTSQTRKLRYLYTLNVLVFFCLIPYARTHLYYVGHTAGWLTTMIWCTYQLPQVIKVFRQRSVQGFSFFLATMCGLAALIEVISGYLLGLPYQTMINSSRGVLLYLIFCLQFWLYRY